jgi:alpha-glucosidase
VQFDHDRGLLRNLAYSSKLHAALKPYLLKLMKEAEQGIPMMRPLFYEYEELWEEKEEYLLGKDILVAPVLTDKTVSREVRLPHDVWIDLYTGKEYTEGTYTIHTGVHYIPVLIRKNREMLDDETLNRLKEILKVNW